MGGRGAGAAGVAATIAKPHEGQKAAPFGIGFPQRGQGILIL